jgi:RNA polymerase sigma-70 factor (ECF subfamily)
VALTAEDLQACYQRLERPLHNVLYRWLWDAQACQDTMHDAFLKLWSQRQRLDAVRLDALVYTTALNLARNRLRWQRLRTWVGVEEATRMPSSGDDDADLQLRTHGLRHALQQLAATDRNLILLSEFAGFDTRELASMLGIAAGTVGSRKHRALSRLRDLIGSGPPDAAG